MACGVRENQGPDADRCAPLPRIGATAEARMILIRLRGRSLDRVGQLFEAYGLMGSWTPALRAALASGLSMVARVAPSRSASSR